MRILTDCPEQITGRAAADSAWSRATDSHLPDDEHTLWRALGGSRPPWIGTVKEASASAFWPRALIVAEAPASQFDTLNALFRSGLRLSSPVACLALEGHNFRGQRSRRWAAVRGNLHLSGAFQPDNFPARHGIALTMLPAVAVVEAIRAVGGETVRPGIKWVNDILIEGRKVAGVLTATQVLAERITHVVVGIGLNVAQAPDVPATPFAHAVGSLAGAGLAVSLMTMFANVLGQLAAYYERLSRYGPAELLEAYRSFSLVIGREVYVWDESVDEFEPGSPLPLPLARGKVRDIGPDLCLWMEGRDEPVMRGRLAFSEHVPDDPLGRR